MHRKTKPAPFTIKRSSSARRGHYGQVDPGRTAQVGGFLFRYLWACHRCVGTDAAPTPRRLTILLAQGAREFDGINVEPYKNPPITRDAKHTDFFRTIVLLDDRAMPELASLEAWRAYVHHYGPIPRALGRRRRS